MSPHGPLCPSEGVEDEASQFALAEEFDPFRTRLAGRLAGSASGSINLRQASTWQRASVRHWICFLRSVFPGQRSALVF